MVNQTLTALGDGRAMRRLAVFAMLSLILAAPAAAQDGRISVPKSEAPAVSLRGAVGEAPGAEGDAQPGGPLAGLVPLPPPVLPVGMNAAPDSRQCKRSCNRDYYFCLSAVEETCAPVWTKCTARCG